MARRNDPSELFDVEVTTDDSTRHEALDKATGEIDAWISIFGAEED